MFSLTANILIGFINHFLFFSYSQNHIKILYTLYISSSLICIGLYLKSNNQSLGYKIYQEIPHSKKGCQHSILKK